MLYFQFNIDDHTRDTLHLTELEDLAYRRMIDLYCKMEQPIPSSIDDVAMMIGMVPHKEIISSVLKEFFIKTESGWDSDRYSKEVQRFRVAKENHWSKSLTISERCAMEAGRRARKSSATPSWLTKEQKCQISDLYRSAKSLTIQTGVNHEVDHIIPIRGKAVCGLHVPWNLRVITAEENRRKGNSLEVS